MYVYSTFWLSLSSFVPGLLAVACYHPNGDPVIDEAYLPCNLVAAGIHSSCCATQRAQFPDRCLPNGLCGNGDDVFRDSCTDQTWESPSCPQLCTAGFGRSGRDIGDKEAPDLKPNYSQKDVALTKCDDGSYCCGSANATCCNQGQGKRINSTLDASFQVGTSSATSGSSTFATPQVNITASTASNNNQSPGLDEKAVVGIALGCGIIGSIIFGSAIWFFFLRERRRSSKSFRKRLSSSTIVEPKHVYELDTNDLPPNRVFVASRRHELGAGEISPELPANRRESSRRWTARLGNLRPWKF